MKKQNIGMLLVLLVLTTACASRKNTTSGPKAQAARVLTESERMEIDFLFFNAQKEKLIGNTGVAENLFVEIIKRDPTNAQAYYEVGRTSMARQQMPRALEFAAQASQLDPRNPWYLRLEADLLRSQGRQREAIAVLRKLSDLPEQDKLAVLLDVSMLHGELNEYNEAIKVLNEIEKQSGPAPELAEQKRQYWVKASKPEKGLEEIRKLSEAFPGDVDFLLYLGQMYFEVKDYPKAKAAFEKALKSEPNNGKIYFALADVTRVLQENSQAYAYLNKAFTFSDVDIDLKVQVLLNLFEDFDRNMELRALALELSETTTRVHPEEAKAWAIRADLLYHSQQFPAAVEAYKKAIDYDASAQKYTVWQQYLLSLLETDQMTVLAKEAEKAVDLFPNQPVPFYLGGVAHFQEKQYEAAVRLLRGGAKVIYGNTGLEAQFYSALGDAYHALDQHEESDASYERSLRLNPENALVLNNYSYYLSLRKQKLDRAEEMSRKSLKIEPKNPSYLDTYGWILYQLGRYAEAKGYIQQAIDAGGPDNGTLLEHLGDVQFQLGEKGEAMENWKRARAAGGASDFIERKIAEERLYE
jgi:tetratricopeptide (TPR) repeat protein